MSFNVVRLVNGVLTTQSQAASLTSYNQTFTGTVTAGTAITLPASGTYQSTELQVYLNGQSLQPVTDWNLVGGSPPRTQITLTFNLLSTDTLQFFFLS